MTVSGAYGRDYKTLEQAKKDWEAHKDFTILSVDGFFGGKYINIEDAERFGISEVWLRYKKNTEKGLLWMRIDTLGYSGTTTV